MDMTVRVYFLYNLLLLKFEIFFTSKHTFYNKCTYQMDYDQIKKSLCGWVLLYSVKIWILPLCLSTVLFQQRIGSSLSKTFSQNFNLRSKMVAGQRLYKSWKLLKLICRYQIFDDPVLAVNILDTVDVYISI